MGVVNEAVEDGVSISRVAEHDITPQYSNDCHRESGSLTQHIRSSVSCLRSAPADRVVGLAGSRWFFRTADIAGSRRKQRISRMRLVRQGRIVISRWCRYAPCFPWRNTCGQGFPPQERGSMKHRAQQLILPLEPALPGRRLILAPRLWPTMTPRAQQQLAQCPSPPAQGRFPPQADRCQQRRRLTPLPKDEKRNLTSGHSPPRPTSIGMAGRHQLEQVADISPECSADIVGIRRPACSDDGCGA
jgi:hypothetical protein